MNSLSILTALIIAMPILFSATSSSAATLKLRNYSCEIHFNEEVSGFTDIKESNMETQTITKRTITRFAASSEHALENIVDSEMKAKVDGSFKVDTGLYEDDLSAIDRNKMARMINTDRESLSSAAIVKFDTRKKIYKQPKGTINCN